MPTSRSSTTATYRWSSAVMITSSTLCDCRGEEDEWSRRRPVAARPAVQAGSIDEAPCPRRAGWGSVPPPRLPARPMREVATIRSPDPLTATPRIGERLASGRQPDQRPGRSRRSGRGDHTHPVMSPAKSRGCGGVRAPVGHGQEPAGGPAAGAAGAGEVAAVEPDALAAVVHHPGLALVVRAEDGRGRPAHACRPRRRASGAGPAGPVTGGHDERPHHGRRTGRLRPAARSARARSGRRRPRRRSPGCHRRRPAGRTAARRSRS